MARQWQMLLVPGFSDCSWAECDVDRGRPVIKRDVLDLSNLHLEGYFQALYVPLGGSRTRKENSFLKSMKLCVSMFNDKCDTPKPGGPIDYRQLVETCVSHIMRPIHE